MGVLRIVSAALCQDVTTAMITGPKRIHFLFIIYFLLTFTFCFCIFIYLAVPVIICNTWDNMSSQV